MRRGMGLSAGLLVAAALAMVACASDPPDPAPARPTTPAVVPAPQSDATVTMADQPPPTATVEPVPTATVGTPAPPATKAPGLPAPTATPVSPPTRIYPQATAPDRFLIRLMDDLDDPLGYCIDVRGFGAGIRLDADLQAHSCKSSGADDQAFAMTGDPGKSSIVLLDYDVCLAVAEPEIGASILLIPCDEASAFQKFEWLSDGRLHLLAEHSDSQPMLCIGVAGGAGEPAGGRNHLRRDLMLRDCAETDPALLAWNPAPNQ